MLQNYKRFGAGSESLHYSTLSAVDTLECKNTYPKIDQNKIVCVKAEHDHCTPDAGTPLVGQTPDGWVLTGIASFGPKKCGKNYPFVFTKVFHYMDWIRENLEE